MAKTKTPVTGQSTVDDEKFPRPPDLLFSALNKATGEKRKIGAAWINHDGSVSISLDAFTTLQSSPDLVLRLFPRDKT
jgi:hypothetical protein